MHIEEKKGIQYRSKVARKMHRTIDRNLSIKINCAMAAAALHSRPDRSKMSRNLKFDVIVMPVFIYT